jgi:glutathione synthase/RimK-type ligase-like ATP-grasp enzyme
MNKRIYLLVDYRRYFYSSATSKQFTMDITKIRDYFSDFGYELKVKKFWEIDFRKDSYKGQYILYQSSEDPWLQYKSYIEDILLGLQEQGAILIPKFLYFRSHHNKVFMEILRNLNDNSRIKNITSRGYGTYEEYIEDLDRYAGDLVVKPSGEAASKGVRLFRSDRQKKKYIKKLSASSTYMTDTFKNLVGPYIKKNYNKRSTHTNKFIIQNYVPGLQNDFKVLVYGSKYYVLRRENRENDFRASGSGLFEWINQPIQKLLDYAESVSNSFDAPFISMDIANQGDEFYLFEFQFVMFGQLTLERSSLYFTRDKNWIAVDEKPILEREFARSIVEFIKKQEGPKASL